MNRLKLSTQAHYGALFIVSIKMPYRLLMALDETAKKYRVTRSELVRELLWRALNNKCGDDYDHL